LDQYTDIFKGYNGTIFVYGQTGSGKTHTMQGPDIHDDEMKGIIPRMIQTIFTEVEQASEKIEFLVKVSYIEIYMEKIRDLMNRMRALFCCIRFANVLTVTLADQTDLKIRENKDKSVYIENVTEEYVTCEDDVIRIMDSGALHRKVAATSIHIVANPLIFGIFVRLTQTDMNDVSSRSHSIFVLTIEQKNLETGGTMSAKLYLVDLAGSEKVGKTGATGQTLDEAKGINKSLSALGNVINALTDGKARDRDLVAMRSNVLIFCAVETRALS
jgi:kinesin family protein 5